MKDKDFGHNASLQTLCVVGFRLCFFGAFALAVVCQSKAANVTDYSFKQKVNRQSNIYSELFVGHSTIERLLTKADKTWKHPVIRAWQKKIASFNLIPQLFKENSNQELEGDLLILQVLGSGFYSQGLYEEALQLFTEALAIARQLGNRSAESTVLSNIGVVYAAQGQYEGALQVLIEALEVAHETGDRDGEMAALNNIGTVYGNQGQYEKALQANTEALEIAQEMGQRGSEGTILNNIGVVYSYQGQYGEALQASTEALEIAREVGDNAGESIRLNSIGAVYLEQGQYEAALQFFDKALVLAQEVGNRAAVGSILINIGAVYSYQEQYEEALQAHTEALKLASEIGNRAEKGRVLMNIAVIYEHQGQYGEALQAHTEALEIAREVGDNAIEGLVYENMAVVYAKQGQYEAALKFFDKALALAQEVGNPANEMSVLSNLAHLYGVQGNLSKAMEAINAALGLVETIHTSIAGEQSRTAFLATIHNYYQFKVDLLMLLGRTTEAFNTSEQSRARGLVELLAEAHIDLSQGVDDPALQQLLQEEQSLQAQLNAHYNRRVKVLSTASEEDLPTLQAELDAEEAELKQALSTVQQQIRAANADLGNLKYPDPLTLQQVQQTLLDQNDILLQYALGPERSYLFAVTPTDLKVYPLAGQEVIEPIATEFFSHLKAQRRMRAIALTGGCLTQHLLPADLLPHLQRKQVIIAADGILHTIPFAALPLPASPSSGQDACAEIFQPPEYAPLIQEFQLINIPSATAIDTLRQQVARRTDHSSRQLAILADPVFADDPRIIGAPPLTCNPSSRSGLEEEESSPEYNPDLPFELQVALDSTRSSLRPLPCTRYEADQIMALVPDTNQRVVALDFSATQEWVDGTSLDQYEMVHFATHGIANNDNPGFSGLLLSEFETPDVSLEDYFLSLQDVFNLDLSASLVVLSACETGQGVNTEGEGIVGLTRGFMFAGAERIISSLWKVDDLATADLMSQFYTNLLTEDVTPSEALREAQIAMWEAGSHPYYWAAFTIQGEWNP
jgi:CHAT domain-containing protein/tetratricopeptide (TPR) repeat protein